MKIISKTVVKIVIILTLLIGGVYYGISCSRNKPEHLYKAAITASAKGDIELAENIYKIIINKYPNSSVSKDAMYQLGLLDYLYLNNYATALERFYDLVYTYPHYSHTFDAYMYMARIYKEHQNMPRKAIEIYEKLLHSAVAVSPERTKRLLSRLAAEYQNIGDITKAADTYEKLLQLYKKKPPAGYLYEFAYLKYLEGHCNEAIKYFSKVSLLYPDTSYSFSAQIAISGCYEETGRSSKALFLLKKLKAEYPTETSIVNIKINNVTERLKNRARR